MGRAREAIREDIFQLDYHEQALLAEEIAENLAKDENMQLWLEEAKRRLEEHRRGEGTSSNHEEVMAKARKMVEDAK